MNLLQYHIYLRLTIDRVMSRPFSARTPSLKKNALPGAAGSEKACNSYADAGVY